MDPRTIDELDALRRRAYGPDADIEQDAAALRRLHELEALAASARDEAAAADAAPEGRRRAPVPAFRTGRTLVDEPVPLPSRAAVRAASAVPRPPADTDAAPTVLEVADDRAPDASGDLADAPAPGRARWSRRRTIVVWALSVALAIAVTASIASLVTRRVGGDGAVEAVLTATSASAEQQGSAFLGEGGIVFADFFGLSPVAPERGRLGVAGLDCFFVVSTENLDRSVDGGLEGPFYSGCGAGEFAPSVVVPVRDDSPQRLRDRFAEGTLLQFVWQGAEMVVLSAPAVS